MNKNTQRRQKELRNAVRKARGTCDRKTRKTRKARSARKIQ